VPDAHKQGLPQQAANSHTHTHKHIHTCAQTHKHSLTWLVFPIPRVDASGSEGSHSGSDIASRHWAIYITLIADGTLDDREQCYCSSKHAGLVLDVGGVDVFVFQSSRGGINTTILQCIGVSVSRVCACVCERFR